MAAHKFKVGQAVEFQAHRLQHDTASGGYKITRLLPAAGHDQQYRIKSPLEIFERIALESQLSEGSGRR